MGIDGVGSYHIQNLWGQNNRARHRASDVDFEFMSSVTEATESMNSRNIFGHTTGGNFRTVQHGLTYRKLIDSFSKRYNDSDIHVPDTVVSRHTEYTNPDTNEKVPVDIKYITSYSKEGISCREEQKVGDKEQSRELWRISFENEDNLEKVKNFLEGFDEEQHLTFASQMDFWKDFLDGSIDIADFKEYFASTNNGIIDYEKEMQGGKSLREITGSTYAGYLNNSSFVGRIYSESELQPSWYRNGIIDIQEVYDSSVPTDAIHIRAEALKTGYGKEASIPVGGAINDRVQIVFAGAVGSANQYFQYADETGIIDYNGIIFYCDSSTDTLKLGDCSNPSECIQISLTDGGSLMVNRDNLEQLFDALPFFSPEDMMVILQVLQKEKMADNSLFGAEQEDDRILELVKEIDGRERKSVNDYQE